MRVHPSSGSSVRSRIFPRAEVSSDEMRGGYAVLYRDLTARLARLPKANEVGSDIGPQGYGPGARLQGRDE